MKAGFETFEIVGAKNLVPIKSMAGRQDTKLTIEVTDVNRWPAIADGRFKAVRDNLG